MTRSRRILVVTDDSVMRASTARTLADLGYVAECCRAPTPAAERVRRRRPAAVLVDVRLASHGCSAFVEACRRNASAAEVPILIMVTTPRAAIDDIRAGAQGCVKTPVNSDTLLPMLSQVHVPIPSLMYA